MENQLVQFDEVRATIAKYKRENANLVFNYEDPQENKDARSHVFKLRKAKTRISEVHKTTKAEALAVCQAIDKEKRVLIADVEEMIEVHAAPIRAIEEKARAEFAKIAREEEAKRQAEEEQRQKEREAREAEVARREAEAEAKEDAIIAEQDRVRREAEQVEREKRIANDATAKAKADAETKAKNIEDARIAKEAAKKAEQARLAEIERKRVADKANRANREGEVCIALNDVIHDLAVAGKVKDAICDGKIPNVTINY